MISTHILDTSRGRPAEGVSVTLEQGLEPGSSDHWKILSCEKTNADGRINFPNEIEAGTYRLRFEVDPYFKAMNTTGFFTDIPVTFRIAELSRHYHVPLLLNPFGYSTYRGS